MYMDDKFLGKRLDGRYEIHDLLGAGGMAYVYKAYDRIEDRWVAIKILKEEFSNDNDFLRRFRNESKAIAVLSNPNIVKIFDVSFGDQIQYIAMEYIDGITLKEYIDQQGTIRWQEALHFMRQILNALESAHQKGIIHRDIKPQNILLLRDGTIKVTDFGIARFLQSETQTMTDKAIGSVHYISPEQARGDYITDKADIYSVGVVLYEMLTGELPFVADNAVSVALMQLQAKPRMPREVNPSIPEGLEQIVMHAMEKNPDDRFHSAGEMLDDIEAFKQDPAIIFKYDYTSSDYVEKSKNIDDYDTVNFSPAEYNDNFEYEEEYVRSKKRKKGSMAVMGVIIAFVVVVLAVGGVYLINYLKDAENEDDDQVNVPNFIGMIYETEIANNDLYSDFVFKVQSGNDPAKEPGSVLNQSPNSGMAVKKGREITLTVNGSEGDKVSVPEVVNYEQSRAVETLTNMDLKARIETIADDNIEVGYVVKTDPVGGSEVTAKSTVTLYVSKGSSKKQVEVPANLVGDLLYNVTAKIQEAGLELGNITYDDNSKLAKDTVISVNPQSGNKVSEGSSVDIVVSSGKNTDKNLSKTISLPNVNQDVNLKVYRNGTVTTNETINPALAGSYTLSFTGTSGSETIVVQLDGQEYIYLSFDYDNQEVTITQQNEFVVSSSSGSED